MAGITLTENDIAILEKVLKAAVFMSQNTNKGIWDFTILINNIQAVINKLDNEEIKEKLKSELEELVKSIQEHRAAVTRDSRKETLRPMDHKTYEELILKIGLLIRTLEGVLPPKNKGFLKRVFGYLKRVFG